MANISIEIPDQVVPRVLQAFTSSGYDPETDGTKVEFTKRQVIKFIKDRVALFEISEATKTARETIEEIEVT